MMPRRFLPEGGRDMASARSMALTFSPKVLVGGEFLNGTFPTLV
jgi:hypothetical protein